MKIDKRENLLQQICVIIPTYNNVSTLFQVITEVLQYTPNVIVVNDGSTDDTAKQLQTQPSIKVISYARNRGKGYALKQGFRKAIEDGFRYAITIDSDGQHLVKDIVRFVEMIEQHPDAFLVGSRYLQQENMPKQNTFANRFSNFWFFVHTFQQIPDTQSGFRLYPLHFLKKMHIFTRKYETELEILVRLAWRFVPIIPIPISVYYAPKEERISHFKPFRDFFRISLLNTIFTGIAIIYFYPKFVLKYIFHYFQKK